MIGGQSGIIKFIVSGILCFGIGVILLNFLSSISWQSDRLLTKPNNNYDSSKLVPSVSSEIKADFESDTKPMQLTIENSKIDSSQTTIRTYKLPAKNPKVLKDFQKINYYLYLGSRNSCSRKW
jgi:hypothetical protein